MDLVTRKDKWCHIDENNIIRNNLQINVENHNNLYDYFEQRFKFCKNQLALVDTDTGLQCSYKDILESSRRIAAFLHKQGVTDGDVMAINARNCYNYIYPMFAAMKQSVGIASYNEFATSFEANEILRDTNAKILFTNADQLEKSKEAANSTNVQILVTFEETEDNSVFFIGDVINSAEYDIDVAPENPSGEVALIYFSSGSTGKPKAAAISKNNLISSINRMKQPFELKGKTTMVPTIFAHASAIINVLLPLHENATIYLVNDSVEKPEKCLKAINSYKISHAFVLSPFCSYLATSPIIKSYDLSSLEILFFGGSTVTPNVIKNLQTRLPKVFIMQAYGMTELSGFSMCQMKGSCQKIGSTGILLPGLKCKIVNRDTLETEGINTAGEIYMQGPSVIKGYLNNPKATSENITDDGWIRTGDIAYFDEDLHFYIVGRVKEIIKLYSGTPLYPSQVENVMMSHPSVLECCVIGKDMGTYEIPIGFVVPKPNSQLDDQELHDVIKEKLSAYKSHTGGIRFMESLPKLANGKLDRPRLKKLLLNEKQ